MSAGRAAQPGSRATPVVTARQQDRSVVGSPQLRALCLLLWSLPGLGVLWGRLPGRTASSLGCTASSVGCTAVTSGSPGSQQQGFSGLSEVEQ